MGDESKLDGGSSTELDEVDVEVTEIDEEKGEETRFDAVDETAGPQPQCGKTATRPRPPDRSNSTIFAWEGAEVIQRTMFEFMYDVATRYSHSRDDGDDCCCYLTVLLCTEVVLALAAALLGPWMLLAASITLAREAWKPDGSDPASSTGRQTNDIQTHALFSKVLTVVEGVLESSPQFALQLISYVLNVREGNVEPVMGIISYHVFFWRISATFSMLGIDSQGHSELVVRFQEDHGGPRTAGDADGSCRWKDSQKGNWDVVLAADEKTIGTRMTKDFKRSPAVPGRCRAERNGIKSRGEDIEGVFSIDTDTKKREEYFFFLREQRRWEGDGHKGGGSLLSQRPPMRVDGTPCSNVWTRPKGP